MLEEDLGPVSSTSCGPSGPVVSYAEYSGPNSHANLATMTATPRTVVDQAWYPDNGVTTHMTNNDLHTHQILLQGTECGGLYQLQPISSYLGLVAFHVTGTKSCAPDMTKFGLWHRRLGHPSADFVVQCLRFCNLSIPKDSARSLCGACELDKSLKLPFYLSQTMYTEPLELIVVDLWGPTPYFSDGKQYYISLVDAFARHTWIYSLTKKSDALFAFLVLKNKLSCSWDAKLSKFRQMVKTLNIGVQSLLEQVANVESEHAVGPVDVTKFLLSNVHPMVTRSKVGVFKPKIYVAELSMIEPKSVYEAMMIPSWQKAIDEEYWALIKNDT
ncbi:Retrovirus-related Pol polyprotein from transposon TNT 1-94 [Gossypium australe]|uniref:Retrovirus-related Pol polyprotein from transposon TNT 1-94 n=1 Tax=Gossypium australe TaxID=47621 RepID=A0A5B6VET1_9ROSI|nr:Retrovirus-related Pol polyprotein from transposon TNT 1-94 [Gossypium australe]